MVFLLLILVYISVCILWNIMFKSTLKLRLASVITAAVLAFGLTLVFKSTASAELLTQILTALQKLGLPVDIILENSGLAKYALKDADIASFSNLPTGCALHPRCPECMDGVCREQVPEPYRVEEGHCVSCYRFRPASAGETT